MEMQPVPRVFLHHIRYITPNYRYRYEKKYFGRKKKMAKKMLK
jgi:hypothetical protein